MVPGWDHKLEDSAVHTVRGAGNLCWQIRISTCTVTISESVVSLLLTPVTGARRQQQSLLAQCV